MRYLLCLSLFFVCLSPAAKAQSTLIPAGTLLHCTTDEPNFTAKSGQPGDPILCHLSQFTQFGVPAFPRGSYLVGHLEAAKQPGRLVGKGYMQITFDQIGLPNTGAELDTKLLAAQGQRVDTQGRIIGKGHAKRDVAEWMFPPLWPWKVIMLPARGPQPKLKNEQQFTLKLMQDVEIPRVSTYSMNTSSENSIGTSNALANPSTRFDSYSLPASVSSISPAGAPLPASLPATLNVSSTELQNDPPAAPPQSGPLQRIYYLPPVAPAAPSAGDPRSYLSPAGNSKPSAASSAASRRLTLLALKSQTIYPATRYWVDGSLLYFALPDGTVKSTDLDFVDWQRTTDLNAERNVRVSLGTAAAQY